MSYVTQTKTLKKHFSCTYIEAAAVYAVNTAIDSDDWETCYEMLKHADLAITGLTIECASTYHEGLQMEKQDKIEEGFCDVVI